MEGVMFYWIMWLFWIYVTFLLNRKHPYRYKLSAVLLIVLIFANFHIQFWGFDLYLGGAFLLFVSYSFFTGSNKPTVFYFLICSIIVMLAYTAFHLFEIFDPAFLIFKREWMMGISLGYLVSLLQKSFTGRLMALISGTMQGEILYALILSKYDFAYPIGSFSYLDTWSLTTLLLFGWSLIERAIALIGNHSYLVQRGKQKSS